ncbi:MAG: sigma-70 family RNA polymerase sigma factor [Candidatus Thiodiazotropha sp.]
MLAVTNLNTESEIVPEVALNEAVDWLLSVAENRDRYAFERLYGYFAPRIKGYMIRQGADEASADDLAQETMVQIWRKAHHYDPQKAAVSTWIFRVARNLQIDRLRKRKLHEVELTAEEEQNDEGLTAHERFEKRPDADRLRTLVGDLPEEQMDVVRLAFFEGLSHSEVSYHLSIPIGTVKSRLRLAFGKLRTGMGEKI